MVIFDVALQKLEVLQLTNQLAGRRSELKKWEKQLEMINALLVDAEEKKLTDGAVKKWLEELQDLAKHAEDILDEYATKDLSWRRDLKIPDCCLGFPRRRSKIEEITSRLEELCEQGAKLGLQTTAGGRSQVSNQRSPTSNFMDPPGFDYKCSYHDGSEFKYPIGQLQACW